MVFQETGRLVSGDRTAPGYLARSGDPYHVPSVNIQISLSLRETGEVVRSAGRISGRCREQDSLFSGLPLPMTLKPMERMRLDQTISANMWRVCNSLMFGNIIMPIMTISRNSIHETCMVVIPRDSGNLRKYDL